MTTLPSGGTLVAASDLSGSPTTYSVLYALTPDCRPDRSFGSDGVEDVSFGGEISSAMALSNGDVVLAGATTKGAAVGRILASGHPDPAFGAAGLTVVPGPADETVLGQTSSGDVLVGISAGGGCCGQERVVELTNTGTVVKTFGSDGSAPIPYPRDDSGISRIAVEPGGDILVLTSGGNMGCWGVTVNALTSSGAAIPSFQANFEQSMRQAAPSGVFVADLVPRARGFELVGAAQAECLEASPDPSAHGQVVAFEANGTLDKTFAPTGEARFPSSFAASVWGLPQPDGTVLMASILPSQEATMNLPVTLHLVDLDPAGIPNRAYGDAGYSSVGLPLTLASLGTTYLAVAPNPTGGTAVSGMNTGHTLELVRFSG